MQFKLAAWLQSALNFLGWLGCGILALSAFGGFIYLTVLFFQSDFGKIAVGYWFFSNCILPLICVVILILFVAGLSLLGRVLSTRSR